MKNNISVIIPVKDRFDLLYKALNSIQNQSLIPQEVVIIDDFSSSLLKLDIKKYKFKILIKRNKKNFGVSKSRNIGIRNSKGTYIAFIDTDDIWDKKKLETEFKLLKKNNLDLTYCNNTKNSELAFEIENSKTILNRLYNLWSHPNCSCMFFKKRTFNIVGLFDEKLKGSEDHDLWFRIARKNLKIGKINKKLVKIEKYNEAQISRNFKIRKESIKYFFFKNQKYIPRKIYKNFKRELTARAFIPVFNNALKKLNFYYLFLSLQYLIFSKIFYKRYFNFLLRNFFN